MAWNTEGQNTSEQKTFINCNGNKTDVTGLSGLGLVEKLKAVAREAGFAKFDIFDSTNRSLSPQDIEGGTYAGDLTLIRFNAAA
jgi:hypothetical protein